LGICLASSIVTTEGKSFDEEERREVRASFIKPLRNPTLLEKKLVTAVLLTENIFTY
jgi:hypothetical protein